MDSCRDGESPLRGLLDEYRKVSRWSHGSKLEAKGFQRWLKEREQG